MTLREAADYITEGTIRAALPDEAVRRALEGKRFGKGRVVLVAIGKAGWQMAHAAAECLGNRIEAGVVVTKYNYVKGQIRDFALYEAGHPVPDQNSFLAAQAVIGMVRGLSAQDTVLFLVSGGGSALFELPLISPDELQSVTGQLLACGADITEINTIRKRLSAVKGGRFAEFCKPARICSIVLSDIIGDPLDMIASGPAYPDRSTSEDALRIVEKYGLTLSSQARELLLRPTPKALDNVETYITGSVSQLCASAADLSRTLGFEPHILTDRLCCTARDAGSFLASIAHTHCRDKHSVAYIAGGETVVQLTGNGLGGRNQELALAAAEGIAGLSNVAIFSVGSDGTDGPTDAAGGYVNGFTRDTLLQKGIRISDVLQNNDAYHGLEQAGGLIKTGPTGTNVNDFCVLLIQGNPVSTEVGSLMLHVQEPKW